MGEARELGELGATDCARGMLGLLTNGTFVTNALLLLFSAKPDLIDFEMPAEPGEDLVDGGAEPEAAET